jgi:hypothetical protein
MRGINFGKTFWPFSGRDLQNFGQFGYNPTQIERKILVGRS